VAEEGARLGEREPRRKLGVEGDATGPVGKNRCAEAAVANMGGKD